MNLGETIYRLRTEKNLSQGDLADALEVSRQSVSKWENNSAVPELEKLIKMAQIFGITIDELVTGEPKAPEVTPPPQPAPVQSRGFPTRKIVGVILLCFGFLTFLVFAVLSFIPKIYLDFSFSLIFSAPFILCGIICLLCKQNAALWCAWAIYLPLWIICAGFMGLGFDFNMAGLLRCSVLVYGVVLAVFTLRKLYKGTLPLWAKILLTVGIVLTIIVTVVGFLPPRTINAAPDYNHQVIVPSDK